MRSTSLRLGCDGALLLSVSEKPASDRNEDGRRCFGRRIGRSCNRRSVASETAFHRISRREMHTSRQTSRAPPNPLPRQLYILHAVASCPSTRSLPTSAVLPTRGA